jgi:hypothetical protein
VECVQVTSVFDLVVHAIISVSLTTASVQHGADDMDVEDFLVRRLEWMFCFWIQPYLSHSQQLPDIFKTISFANLSMCDVKLSGLSTFRPSIVEVGVNELKLNATYDYLEVHSIYTLRTFMSRSRGLWRFEKETELSLPDLQDLLCLCTRTYKLRVTQSMPLMETRKSKLRNP